VRSSLVPEKPSCVVRLVVTPLVVGHGTVLEIAAECGDAVTARDLGDRLSPWRDEGALQHGCVLKRRGSRGTMSTSSGRVERFAASMVVGDRGGVQAIRCRRRGASRGACRRPTTQCAEQAGGEFGVAHR